MNKNPRKPEIGEMVQEENESSEVNKTGTTTVGIVAQDGVAVATDRRASLGGRFVSSKDVVKVEQVHPTGVITLVGSVGGAQSFNQNLEAEASLYESRRGEPMSIKALSNLAGNFARSGPFLRINPIVGGVDSDGAHVYTIDPAGGVMEAEDYTVTGSGMQIAFGTLENNYSEGLTVDEALRVAGQAVESAAERDTASGNGLVTARINSEGVKIKEYDDYSVVENL